MKQAACVSPRTVVQLYMLIAISVKGKSVIWKSPEVWARGRLCAQSPRSRRGKPLAAWGLGPCSARKGETAEGPWSHQLSSHTPALHYFRGGFTTVQNASGIKYWHPCRKKTRKFEAKSAQSKIMFSTLFTRRQNWNEYGSKRWTLESTQAQASESLCSMSIVNVSDWTKMTSTFVLLVLMTNVFSVYVSCFNGLTSRLVKITSSFGSWSSRSASSKSLSIISSISRLASSCRSPKNPGYESDRSCDQQMKST